MLPAPLALACPPWCALPAGHGLDDPTQLDIDGTLLRRHTAVLLDDAVQLIEVERIDMIGGPNPGIGRPVVLVGGVNERTAEQARQLAAAYGRAAEILDRQALPSPRPPTT